MNNPAPDGLVSSRRVRLSPLRDFARGCVFLAGMFACSAPLSAADPRPLVPGDWTLTFQDEFSGDALDGTKWRLGSHHGGIAGAGGTSPKNVSVADGRLRITAEQRPVSYGGVNYNYATGEISTFFNHRQQHGYIEARIKYPAVTGLWPAFWLMPDRANYGWRDAYRRSYLKFDLSSAGLSSVSSATLTLKVSSLETGGINNLVVMGLEDDSWTESGITWNNKPAPDPVWLAQRWNNLVSVGDEITIDVTDYVRREVAGDGVVGLVLADTFMRTKLLAFHSREAANPADRPRLVVNGVAHTPVADATVRWGTLADVNYGSAPDLGVKDDWGDTATTFSGGMEIDIMESLGIWGPDVTSHALHWDGYGAQHKHAAWLGVDHPATPDGFHTYGVYWEPGLVAFYVDGIRTAEYADARVLSVPAYFLLSLQLGGWDNNNPGPQVHGQVMEVDWVRAWSGVRSAPTTVTVDNSDAAHVAVVGDWTASSHTWGYQGSNYAHDGDTGKGAKSFSYLPPLTADGDYLVYARWASDPNRADNVPIDIVSADGQADTVIVNQRVDGGRWNLLGVHALAVLNAEATIRTGGTNGHVIADAFRFRPVPTAGAITVDDGDAARVVVTGAWTASTSASAYLGAGYAHDGNTGKGAKSFAFKPAVAAAGDHLVYARWPADSNRASNVPVDIVQTGGAVATVTVNQRLNSNEWVLLGVFPLSPANAEVRLRTGGTNGYVIADGVRVIPVGAP